MKYLVIVESPAKKKPIEKYLGPDYLVQASYGHIRDLPSKAGSVLPDRDFEMKYVISERSEKHVADIARFAKKAKVIYLATDPDREGESIAWHVAEVLKERKIVNTDDIFKRVAFNEITKKAVTHAIAHPRNIDNDLVNAQQARRALDYLVGFTLSPLLWRKLPGCKSAGRVQSVALRLICEREDAIERFKSEEYWDITLNMLTNNNVEFTSKLTHAYGNKLEKFSLNNEKSAGDLVNALKGQEFSVTKLEKKQQKRNPHAPFITSTLQQEAARKLGFSAKKTMQIAQKLYEGITIDGESVGLITYMRTDGVSLSSDAVAAIRASIKKNFGDKYLPAAPRVYKSKVKNAQEAHEAIRPTDIGITPDKIKPLVDGDYYKLYDLICKRTIASQMESVVIDMVAADLTSKDKNFIARATGSTIVFDGFYKIYQEGLDDDKEEENRALPPLSEGEGIAVKKITPLQHFTEAPPRYSEASLVKSLEEKGIGRPSTYASILSVLQEREYVALSKKRFIPEERGRLLTAFLLGFFKCYIEYDFTAQLETELDEVAEGVLKWKKLLLKFWEGFNENILKVGDKATSEIIDFVQGELDYHLFGGNEEVKVCPSCTGGKLALKLGKFGAFLGCSNYPECNFKKQIVAGEQNQEDGGASLVENNNKLLGIDDQGIAVHLKKGPYGWYVQLGEQVLKSEKPKRASLPPGLKPDDIDLNKAVSLLKLPMMIGAHPDTNNEMMMGIGRFGPYIKYEGKFISIPKNIDPFSINIDQAVAIIVNDKNKVKKAKK
jgi:DNA topoisomerase I